MKLKRLNKPTHLAVWFVFRPQFFDDFTVLRGITILGLASSPVLSKRWERYVGRCTVSLDQINLPIPWVHLNELMTYMTLDTSIANMERFISQANKLQLTVNVTKLITYWL